MSEELGEGPLPELMARLATRGWVAPSDSILVVCGGPRDRNALAAAGFTDVHVTSLEADLEEGIEEMDTHAISFDDGTFDIVLVNAGLHHCHAPHQALAEMHRVARKAVIVLEAQDSACVRLLVHLGMLLDYECAAVASNDYRAGGVDNTALPNYIYRWTRREIEKTIRALDPAHEPVSYTHLTLPTN